MRQYPAALATLLLFFAITFPIAAQTPIPSDIPVKEDFNATGSGLALPVNWKVSVAGGGATATTSRVSSHSVFHKFGLNVSLSVAKISSPRSSYI